MKIFDPNALVPYEVVPLPEDEANQAVTSRDQGRRSAGLLSMLAGEQEKFLHQLAVDRADKTWLETNTPMGTVFEVLGVAHMVVSLPHYIKTPERPGWGPMLVNVMAPDGRGGIDRSVLSCTQLRAMLEPGFVRP
ncbi:hypothetical protein [Stenotrophomonas phage DLP4]|nr:hypothetical protein [Stenotrophomonas phage DLP4]